MENQLIVFNSNNRDYTYKKYENNTFKGQSAVQSLFNGSQFINCRIENCDFSRCDYEGMNIIGNYIDSSNYRNADIKSVIWKDCIINNCVFDDAYITNNIFINCIFNNCSFFNSVFLRNTVNKTEFNKCVITQSTFSLSVFTKCTFNTMSLGDCSFYKHVMDSCNYYDVSMNIDSTGQIFGLDQKTIKSITYIFLGKEYGNIKDYGIERLINVFKQREWLFDEIILRYNCNLISNYELIVQIANYFSQRIFDDKIIKQDEFEFFILILESLKHSKKLPLFALIYMYQNLYEGIINVRNNVNKLNNINVKVFMNQIIIIINEMLEEYYQFAAIETTIEATTIALHYESNEIIYFNIIINELNNLFNLGIQTPAKLVEIKKGTYIEIIAASILGIAALQFFLYGINGVLLQLIDLKSKWKVLTSKKTPSYIMSLTKEGKQIQPQACQIILNCIKEKNLNSTLIHYASKLRGIKFISENAENIPSGQNDNDEI